MEWVAMLYGIAALGAFLTLWGAAVVGSRADDRYGEPDEGS